MHQAGVPPKNDWKSVKALAMSKGIPYKQNDIMRMDYSWEFLSKFVPMGMQIIDRKGMMKLSPLHATMMGPSGGVSDDYMDSIYLYMIQYRY